MAIETKCQTEGAIYNTDISDNEITVSIKIPFNLNLDADESELLELNLHNAIELVLSRYFLDKKSGVDDIKRFNEFK